MLTTAFPADAALTLARAQSEDKPGTSLANSRLGAAYGLLGYALARLEHPEPRDDEPDATDAAHAATDAPTDEAPKKGRKKKDAVPHEDIPSLLSAHAKARVKQGGMDVPPPVEARALAEYCLKEIGDLLKND